METLNISTKRASEDVGQIISREYADYLINGFKEKFPNEKSKLFIAKETIVNAINQLDNITGIRFMYGYSTVNIEGMKMLSRVVLLTPCNNITQNEIPEAILPTQGYFSNTGELMDWKKSKKVLYNHSVHFAKYFPGIEFNKIMRGAFMGINTLRTILETKDFAGIDFNFGYDDAIQDIPLKNKPVFEIVDLNDDIFILYDMIQPCPPSCN